MSKMDTVIAESAEAIETALIEMRAELPKCATDEASRLQRTIERETITCVSLAQTQLHPASSTPKRMAATQRLVVALGAIQLANHELHAALCDVEDAV